MYLLLLDPSTYSEKNNSVGVGGRALLQLKVLGLTLKVTLPQLSLLLLLMSATATVTLPVPSNTSAAVLQRAMGGSSSFTVTVNEQVAAGVQPFEAVTITLVTPLLKVEPLPVPLPLPVVALVKA